MPVTSVSRAATCPAPRRSCRCGYFPAGNRSANTNQRQGTGAGRRAYNSQGLFMTVISGKPPAPQKTKKRSELRKPIDPLDDEPAIYDDALKRKTRWSILWTVVRILT